MRMIDDNLGRVQVNAEEELTILSSCTVAVREEIRNILTKTKTKTKRKTKIKTKTMAKLPLGETWREVVQMPLHSMGEGRKQDENGQNTDHHNVWSGRKKL